MKGRPIDERRVVTPPQSRLWVLATMFLGSWLKLGDDDESDVKAQISSEMVNISLISALIFTVAADFFFNVDGFDWDGIEERWGEFMARVLHDVLLTVSFASCCSTIVSTFACVLIMVVNGEFAGSEEAEVFQRMMGLRLSYGFQTLCAGIFLLAFFFSLTAVALSDTWWAVGLVFAFLLLNGVSLVYVITYAVHMLYKIKHAFQTGKAVQLSAVEVQTYAGQYLALVGSPHQLSAANLASFIRMQLLRRDDGGDRSARETPVVLSGLSAALIERVVHDKLQEHVDAQMRSVESIQLSIVPPLGDRSPSLDKRLGSASKQQQAALSSASVSA